MRHRAIAAWVVVFAAPAHGQLACCVQGGDCVSAASEAQCIALGGIILPGPDCSADPCVPAACCDGLSCAMADAFACITNGRTYAGAGTTCLDDPCGAGIGACCFDTGACADLSPAACSGSGGTWQGAGTNCTGSLCVLGACCAPGQCFDGALFECNAAGGSFIAGGFCSDGACEVVHDCALDSLYSQPRDGPSGFTAFTSEEAANLRRTDNYSGAAGAIEAIRWWGLDLEFIGGTFVECVETTNVFDIEFYANTAGQPGDLVCSYTLTAVRQPTGIFYEGAELNQYSADLPEPCILAEGWLSIVGRGDADCWFLWMSSSTGDGQSLCDNCQSPLEDSDLSFCLIGSFGGVFGACCDQTSGQCSEAVEIQDCIGPGLVFAPDALCFEILPPCAAETGACCHDDGTPCAIDDPAGCAAAGGLWLGPDTICGECLPAGACCVPSGCLLTLETACTEFGSVWLGPETTCERCPSVPECRAGGLFAQNPETPKGFTAGTSEVASPFTRYEDFSAVAGAVESLTWWGLDLQPAGGNNFIECAESDPTFEISFHEDAGGVPGAAVCSYTLLATRTPLGLLYLGAELNEYSATLPQPCVIVNGWISIAGVGESDCWFLWMSAAEGNGGSYCDGCNPEPQGFDLNVCLGGTEGGVFGACCHDSSGICQDGVEITDCLAEDDRFVHHGRCADLVPPCGTILGACCFGDATCAIETGGDCAAAGGTWLGADTLCDQCPCVAPCPGGGRPEGEETCHDGYADTFNGGCTAPLPAFAPLANGQTVCGVSGVFNDGANADFDWYEVVMIATVNLSWTVVAEFPAQVYIIDASQGCPGAVLSSNTSSECEEVSIAANVRPGTYWLVVAPVAFTDSAACGAAYTATVSGFPFCPADTNGDGNVDVQDLTAVILAWGTADRDADVNGDGLVNVGDLTEVILAWGGCGD